VSITWGMIRKKLRPERWNINKKVDADVSFEN
jgi:hypothetical protein